MKIVRAAAAFAVLVTPLSAYLARPAHAQMPNVNLLGDNTPAKTDEEKDAESARDQAYKDTLKKIPDAKASSDPWGGVRNAGTPSTAAKPAPRPPRTAAAKKTRAGSNPD